MCNEACQVPSKINGPYHQQIEQGKETSQGEMLPQKFKNLIPYCVIYRAFQKNSVWLTVLIAEEHSDSFKLLPTIKGSCKLIYGNKIPETFSIGQQSSKDEL